MNPNKQETSSSGNVTPGLQVVSTDVIGGDDWLVFKRKEFINLAGEKQSWTYAERVANRQAVVVIPRFQDGSVLLIKQFRVPIEAWIYEFPAGLIDEGETPSAAALRELVEETGYSGKIIRIGPSMPTSPGMSTETVHIAEVLVDSVPDSHQREHSEAIEVFILPYMGIAPFMETIIGNGELVDVKLYTWLLAISRNGSAI